MAATSYAFAHFAVDLGCAFCIFSRSAGPQDYFLYNLFAFAIQMPLGLLADILNKNRLFAILGTLLVGICCLFPAQGLGFVCLLGLGNGLFHIGGGLDVMNLSPAKAAPLGVFVSPGALGVYLGTVLGKGSRGAFPILAALLWSLIWMLLFCRKSALVPNEPVALPKKNVLLPALLLFLVVVLRSMGGAVSLPWKTGVMGLAAVCAVVLGKALGGILADRFGMCLVCLGSLILAMVLFFFADHAAAGLTALLLFNMTMPITLFILSKAMPNTKGFAFGLLTFALFLGFLPGFFGMDKLSPTAMAIVSLISCVLLLPALKAGDGK